ncbi:N-acetylglucosamine-6-phosphate deacetylase [Richelia intracellularis]|nr:N-acetylglucosamine-6-phosphate deacetylase [Richelia intracellularis]
MYYSHIVKIVTLAPELDPTGEVIPYLAFPGYNRQFGAFPSKCSRSQTSFWTWEQTW